MNRKLIAGVVIVAIAVGAAAYYALHGSGDDARATTLYGNVDIRQVSVSFRVSGRVADIRVDEGASVRAGEVLAVLDPEPLRNALHGSEAVVASLSARNALIHHGYRSEDVGQAKALR
jgi:HlyD family secretion protein